MKILMIAPCAPYPSNSGTRIRLWEQIKYLGQRHELTVAFFADTPEEHRQCVLLDDFCQQAIPVTHPPKPSANNKSQGFNVFDWYNVPEMHQTLAALNTKKNFDLTIIEQIFMAQYQTHCTAPVILQEHNIESNIPKRLAAIDQMDGQQQSFNKQTIQKAKWMLTVRQENQTWPKFPLRITVSDQDKEEMDRRCQAGKSVVIENGIDTQAITLVANENAHKILFMGTMNYEPNIDAVFYFRSEIFPILWKTDPTISLVVAGRNPTKALRDLGSDSRIEVIPNPKDMSDIARSCCLSVVPLRSGSGTRIKILHALAMGLPVVSTSIGAEGLAVTDGTNIFIRDDPETFAGAVLQLMANASLRDQFRTAGRLLVEARYDWSRMFARLDEELVELVMQR